MQGMYSAAAHWVGNLDERDLAKWAGELRQQIEPAKVSLGLAFLGPRFLPNAAEVLDILRLNAHIPLLVGSSGAGLIANAEEYEHNPGLVLGLYALPGAELEAMHLTQSQAEEASAASWHSVTRTPAAGANAWLAFGDPFTFDCEGWLRSWNAAYPNQPVIGGMASNSPEQRQTSLFINDQVFNDGCVVVKVGGKITLASMISQGCTPIGETWTITKVDRNLIYEIGNRPAYQVLVETFHSLPPKVRTQAQGNLFVGFVMNEYQEEFHRGDFLVGNLLGADLQSGALAVGALPRAGQTIQFQRRDAATSREDMNFHLNHTQEELAGRTIYGACLCSCNGRGQRLFGEPHHDAAQVRETFGPMGVTGFFCNGEIGPVGGRNYIHGYTASLGLFVDKT